MRGFTRFHSTDGNRIANFFGEAQFFGMTQEEARPRVVEGQKKWPRASYKLTALSMLGALAIGVSAEGWRPLSLVAGGLVGAFFGLLIVCACRVSKPWLAIPMSLLAAFGFPAVLLLFLLGFPAGFEGLTCSIQF